VDVKESLESCVRCKGLQEMLSILINKVL